MLWQHYLILVFNVKSAESFAKTAELAAQREAAGEISLAERQQVEIAAGRFQADALVAQAAYQTALLQLEAVLGVPSRARARALADDLASMAAATGAEAFPAASDEAVLDRRPEIDDGGEDPREELAFHAQLNNYAQTVRQQSGGVARAWKPGAPPAAWAGD